MSAKKVGISALMAVYLGSGAVPVLAETPAAGDAYAYIISPAHGEHVSSPVKIRFGLSGMGVAPAGVERDNTGHHHLLINVQSLPDLSQPIPNDEWHRHFGAGQTEVELTLPPGSHTLRLILGDHAHRPHQPPVFSDAVTVHVKERQ